MSEMTPREVIEEVVRRVGTGESIDAFFAPGYRPTTSSPGLVAGIEPSGTPDQQIAQFTAGSTEIRIRSVTGAPGDRFLVESVWIHRGRNGAGSSGMFWSVLPVEHGLITGERHFERREEACAFAGVSPDQDG